MPSNAAAAKAAIDEKDLHHIGDVSRLTAVKPFVLRFWESEFPMLQPLKSSGGRRLYRQEDVDLVFRIKRLLYDEGFTIAGARRYLREHSGAAENDEITIRGTEGAGQLLSRKMLPGLRGALPAFLTLPERRGRACCFPHHSR